MRNDTSKWDVPELAIAEQIGGVTITTAPVARQTLVSGQAVLTQISHPLVRWPDVAVTDVYALALRRDRVLVINGAGMAEGWDDTTAQAVSDASDAYHVIDLAGDTAFDVLKRGCDVRLDVPSGSVARVCFGLGVFLYRHGTKQSFRLHIGSAHADALVKSLKHAALAV